MSLVTILALLVTAYELVKFAFGIHADVLDQMPVHAFEWKIFRLRLYGLCLSDVCLHIQLLLLNQSKIHQYCFIPSFIILRSDIQINRVNRCIYFQKKYKPTIASGLINIIIMIINLCRRQFANFKFNYVFRAAITHNKNIKKQNSRQKPIKDAKPHKPQKTNNSQKQNPPTQSAKTTEQKTNDFDWSAYGRDVAEVFQSNKNEVRDIDLAFIAKKIELNELTLNEQLASQLNIYFKQLKTVDFSLIPILLQLCFQLGMLNPPQVFAKSFIDNYKINTFENNQGQIKDFPSYFIKKIGYQLVKLCESKNFDEMASALRSVGSLLSANQLTKIDESCCNKIQNMSIENIVRLLSIFRQIKRKGQFVALAEEMIVLHQKELNNKYLLMAVINLLELGNVEGVAQLEKGMIERIAGKSLKDSQVISLLHILHKYKTGNKLIWVQFQRFLASKHANIPFQHLFALMSGFARNRYSQKKLFQSLIEFDRSLNYVPQLNEKQFVQFFLVLYANFRGLSLTQKTIYSPIIKAALLKTHQKSVYKQLKFFFHYLFELNQKTKRQQLTKTYPDNILLALLSLAFKDIENFDSLQQKEYENSLLSRYSPTEYNTHKDLIVVEEFIRHKLMSALKDEVYKQSQHS